MSSLLRVFAIGIVALFCVVVLTIIAASFFHTLSVDIQSILPAEQTVAYIVDDAKQWRTLWETASLPFGESGEVTALVESGTSFRVASLKRSTQGAQGQSIGPYSVSGSGTEVLLHSSSVTLANTPLFRRLLPEELPVLYMNMRKLRTLRKSTTLIDDVLRLLGTKNSSTLLATESRLYVENIPKKSTMTQATMPSTPGSILSLQSMTALPFEALSEEHKALLTSLFAALLGEQATAHVNRLQETLHSVVGVQLRAMSGAYVGTLVMTPDVRDLLRSILQQGMQSSVISTVYDNRFHWRSVTESSKESWMQSKGVDVMNLGHGPYAFRIVSTPSAVFLTNDQEMYNAIFLENSQPSFTKEKDFFSGDLAEIATWWRKEFNEESTILRTIGKTTLSAVFIPTTENSGYFQEAL